MPLRSPLILALLAACLAVGRAEELSVLDLNYESAIRYALGKNFGIRSAGFLPKIASANQLSASGKFDPILRLADTYNENRNFLEVLNANTISTSNLLTRQTGMKYESGLNGLLPWGLNYDLGATFNRNTDTRRVSGLPQYTSFIGATLTQPLLRNFGTDVNLASLRIARADVAISRWQLRARIIDIVTRTIGMYSDLYFSIRNLEVEQASLGLARQTLSDNSQRAEIGVMSPLDVVQAQADVAAREERVLVAERAVADNENFLKELVTDDVSGILDVRVRIAPPPEDPAADIDLHNDLKSTFELRPEYRQALLDIQKRNINVVFTRNQELPRLDLIASLGLNGISSDLGESLSRVASSSPNTSWSAGAVMSVPIPNRTARGVYEANELEVARALVDLKALEQSIYVEVDNAAGQIGTTQKRIQATRTAREFAQLTLDAAQERLASGKSTTFEVLQFQRDLAVAQINEVRAQTDHLKAIARYYQLTGSTLGRLGISAE